MKSEWCSYRRVNLILGLFTFLVAAIVYGSTVEPTSSFWDCGEFILSAFKLQVGHPPGAPIFLMIGRIATLFAGGDVTKVAMMSNLLSAICSALTIMFLFWSITHIVKKAFNDDGEDDMKHIFAIMGAGLLGAFTYTFSDTFWFSAVEGELYAMSSLFTAIVFWAILKWEEEADEPTAGRWIILVAFMMGLGLGIHRLNLLILPVMVFVFYFKKYEFSWKGFWKTSLMAIIILGSVVFVIIPGVPKVAGWFELLFVNGLGLPYNTGLIVFVVVTIAALVFAIRYTFNKKKIILNYIVTCLTVIMIGYSSYAMIVIRSSASPPMNQNDTSEIFSLEYYINMEQYGSAPKLYGQFYTAPRIGDKKVVAGYNKVNGKYEPYYRPEYDYSEQFQTIFPRMYSDSEGHPEAYEYWGQVTGRKYTVRSGSNESQTIVCPTFGENLRFFFRYQVGFMYLRYFMWNFAGRQNDIQGNGNNIYSNWISGIIFLDNARLGDQESLPADLKNNPGNNRYFMIPLLLGLLGLIWQYKKDNNDFIVVLSFFIMTGLAIIVYLNQTPNQPRERDYAYVGSFYAFAIWIGLSLVPIYNAMRKYLNNKVAAIISTLVLLAACPALMANENWDDHDRSGRYTARDIGANYLNSTAPNSIIFTYGDNDSFPVWYAQEVEGVRTDVRVINLSYFQAGWYIKMMRQKAYESDPIPMTLPNEKYNDGTRDQLLINSTGRAVPIKDAVLFAGQDDRRYMYELSRGEFFNYLPSNVFTIDVDSQKVLSNGTVKDYYKDRLVSPMTWNYSSDYVLKGNFAIMDLLATNDWDRPIYFSTTVPSSQYNGLENFFIQEGLAYRVAPIKIDEPAPGSFGMIDPYVMYDNVMNKFRWGNAEDPSVYLDETNRRMFSNFRNTMGDLGKALLNLGDTTKAIEVADKGMALVPHSKMPYDYFMITIAEVYLRAGETEKGEALLGDIIEYAKEYLQYISSLDSKFKYGLDYPMGINMQTILDIYRLSVNLGMAPLADISEALINDYYYKLYSY